MTAFKLHEMKTDIFQIPQTYSLAHAVSADLNTSKGTLAWQFSLVFGQFDDLSKQQIHTGNMAVMEDSSRFIYFLVTKDSVYETSTYDTLHAALICMREHMRNHEIMKVAMPRICCGSDGLKWRKVKEIINQVFAREYVEIMICDHDAPPVPLIPKCKFVEVKGNIFTSPPDYSLVHTVSSDFAMCAGVGLEFKCKFGRVNELVKQNKHTGNVAVLKDNERHIYNLITKEHNHEKSTYPALYYALIAMREHMVYLIAFAAIVNTDVNSELNYILQHQHNVTKLAIPRLGCGIDRLDWLRVKNVLEFVFGNDNIEILAYFHDPPEVVQRRSKSRSLSNVSGRMSVPRD